MSEQTAPVDIYALVDQYRAVLDRKDELADLTTENNKAIEAARNELARAMIEAESPRISRNGFSYSLGEKTKYNKRACNEEEFFDFLREQGLGDIIKPTVNARTLDSAMKELVGELREEAEAEAEDPEEIKSDWLPEDFAPFISAYSFYDVAKRKETNKTAKRAKEKNE